LATLFGHKNTQQEVENSRLTWLDKKNRFGTIAVEKLGRWV
jgi:hypothetical protein